MNVWQPWWTYRTQFASKKIQEVRGKDDQSYNMNRFGQERMSNEVEDISQEQLQAEDNDSDYEDVSDGEEEVEIKGEEQDDYMLLSSIYNERLSAIPDLSSLLKTKQPAASLPFLMVSNLASFLFYSRYYNGNMLDVDTLKITSNLTEQLLSVSSQRDVNQEFQSAYFDHLKALVHIGKLSAQTISDFQPMVLQDLKQILQDSQLGNQLVAEAFLRYYDLLCFAEQLCLDRKKQKHLRKAIAGSKQKLIFYLSYLKSSRPGGTAWWQVSELGTAAFVELFSNDRMYQKISQSQKQ